MEFFFNKQALKIRKTNHSNGRMALVILDKETGEPFTTLTANIPDIPLKKGEFFIKTWSENEEIAQVVFDSGIFKDTGKRAKSGFVTAEIWKFKNKNAASQIPEMLIANRGSEYGNQTIKKN